VARIKDSSVRDIVEAADMVEVVSARTQLRRVGARYTGRCPFHEERTPSFSVNAQDKLYYCFGCGKGGDVITFVRETESLDFAEAVEWLAERYRVPLEYEEGSPRREAERSRRERLHSLLERATAFYEHALWESSAGALARDYLASRGLAEGVCREFRLGYAPGGPTLTRKAHESGFAQAELAAAGLGNRRGNDYFSRRLLFALADARGRVVGFGARRLYEDDPLRAKYVNSPESELFHKQAIVYGLDRAREAIAKEDRVVVVEGYADVLALRQAGFLPVVASMGTALTDRQLKELARHTHRLFLCFDADAAGEAATLRGMELAVRASFDVRVVALEPGTDPADDPDGFDRRLGAAESYARYRVRIEIERAPDRQTAYQRVREVLNGLEESVDRHEAWQYANDRLGMTVQIQATGATQMSQPVSPRLLEAGPRLERDALAGFVAHPELVHLLADLSPEHFDDELHRSLRAHLIEPGETPPDLLALLAELDARAAAEGIDEETAKELLLRLRERRLRRELAATSDLARTKELQELLSRVRETAGDLA
jgi:DNA primase